MSYLSVKEVAESLGLTPRRVQQMCKNGEIDGAKKSKHGWIIPVDSSTFAEDEYKYHYKISDESFALRETAISSGYSRKNVVSNATNKKPLPIGISDFKRATTDYYYVDKTLLIRDFLDNKPQVSLFTRPRRFGKTLNMDMLRVFFEKTDEDTSVYFKDKLIWQCGKYYRSFQGKYPVIFLTFKDIKSSTWAETLDMITKLISLEFQRHSELENSQKLSQIEREKHLAIASGNADITEFQMSLTTLSAQLYKHYGERVIIIIDEYDSPIQQGHVCGFYNEIIEFMRGLFSGGLKDNNALEYGFLTGILRIAKESIFSGLNNLKIYSVLDNSYSEYFGFTKEEIDGLLSYYGYSEKSEEIADWYDGYIFGESEIYNPWSVINYISDKCFPKAFWLSTGSNEIIGEVISAATPEIMENLHMLLRGETVTTYVDTAVIYPEVPENPYSIFSFLLVAGYLKISRSYPQNDGNYMCEVAIPNKEISFVYEKEIIDRIVNVFTPSISISIQQAIFKKDINKLNELLNQFMLSAVSIYDGTSEAFYHGLMLGLCAILSNRYTVLSNREAGMGRFDISLIPREALLPGYIFEFKYAKNDKIDLNILANDALTQINDKKYDAALQDSIATEIIKVGIAFRGKKAATAWE